MASKAFEAGVRSIFAPRLEALGFTRKGIRYIRPRPPWLIQALDIQQDKYNGSGFCRFTINLTRMLGPGLTRAELLEHALSRTLTRPSANTIRLGHLTEIREDHWYDYTPGHGRNRSRAPRGARRYRALWPVMARMGPDQAVARAGPITRTGRSRPLGCLCRQPATREWRGNRAAITAVHPALTLTRSNGTNAHPRNCIP